MEDKDQGLLEMEQRTEEARQQPGQPDQRKRKLKKGILIAAGGILALVAVVFLTLFIAMSKDKESPAMAERMIQAVINQDEEAAYALMYPGVVSQEEFAQGFTRICGLWITQGGGGSFEMKRTGWSVEKKKGVTKYTTTYTVTSGEVRFAFTLVRAVHGERSGMVGAQLSQPLS